jgi:WW domain-containing oxidoreductase
LFAKELQKRLDAVGNKNITVVSLHPGDINTELGRYHIGAKIYYTLATPFLKSVPQGAATTIYCAVYPSVRGKGGEYFSDCQEGDHTEFAKDMEVAKKLFDMSEELTKTKIPADLFN